MDSDLDPDDPTAVAAFVRSRGLGVVATVDPAGRPEAALVGLGASDDGTLILDAHHTSRKIANLRDHPHVAVVVGWDEEVTLQIEGTAAVVDGDLRARYGRIYNEQLPGSHALDDGVVVVAIRPTWVRRYTAAADGPRVVEARWDDAGHRAVARIALAAIADASLPEGADDDALAVAEALLGRPLPASTAALLRIADGLRIGETTIYCTDELPDRNDDETFRWMLPGFVLIGRAGPDRALVVHGASEGVLEVPNDPWDAARQELTADDPLDLVLRHHGSPLAARPPDWAWPGVAAVVEQVCARGLARGAALLTGADLLGRSGAGDEPTELGGLPVLPVAEPARAAALLRSPELADAMNNPRPQLADLGPTARQACERACDQVADRMRAPLRALARSAAPTTEAPDGETELVLDVLTTCVLADTMAELAAQAPGAGARDRRWTAMLTVAEAGYLPLGVTADGSVLLH